MPVITRWTSLSHRNYRQVSLFERQKFILTFSHLKLCWASSTAFASPQVILMLRGDLFALPLPIELSSVHQVLLARIELHRPPTVEILVRLVFSKHNVFILWLAFQLGNQGFSLGSRYQLFYFWLVHESVCIRNDFIWCLVVLTWWLKSAEWTSLLRKHITAKMHSVFLEVVESFLFKQVPDLLTSQGVCFGNNSSFFRVQVEV